jgi:hypothetical protein
MGKLHLGQVVVCAGFDTGSGFPQRLQNFDFELLAD